MDDQVQSLWNQLDKARKHMGELGSSNPLAQRRGAEAKYGQIYQQLVKIGAAPQIKAKYRW